MQWNDEDMGEREQRVKEPGKYLSEVKDVKEKITSNGNTMWALKFVDGEGSLLCWDNLVFNGAGKGIAMKKMSVLGVRKNSKGFYRIDSPEELIGLRAKLDLKEDRYTDSTGKLKDRLVLNFYGEGDFGYLPENAEESDDIPRRPV